MVIEKFRREHIESAAKLLVENYEEERKSVPALPENDYFDRFCALISDGAENNHGVAALQSGELVGFISGIWCIDAFKGINRAAYCPIHAHGAKGDKNDIYQRMYENIADIWVKNGCLTHALTVFAHDKITIDTWFNLGFGNMCVDAIRPLTDVSGNKKNSCNSRFTIRPATQDDAELLLPLMQAHDRYYASSPLFMPVFGITKLSDININTTSKSITFIALDNNNGTPVGILDVGVKDATFVDEDEKTLHLSGAYIAEEARGMGLGAALLQSAVEWLRDNGYERFYVDYESFNRFGSRFYDKHFTPFAYSIFRKLDERITWANADRFNGIVL